MYNVLFPSGKIKCYYVKDVAEMFCQINNGIILPEALDNDAENGYNDSIVIDMEIV